MAGASPILVQLLYYTCQSGPYHRHSQAAADKARASEFRRRICQYAQETSDARNAVSRRLAKPAGK